MNSFTVQLYRYNPETDSSPFTQSVQVDERSRTRMVLDVLEHLKTVDPTLSFRRSCREGVWF